MRVASFVNLFRLSHRRSQAVNNPPIVGRRSSRSRRSNCSSRFNRSSCSDRLERRGALKHLERLNRERRERNLFVLHCDDEPQYRRRQAESERLGGKPQAGSAVGRGEFDALGRCIRTKDGYPMARPGGIRRKNSSRDARELSGSALRRRQTNRWRTPGRYGMRPL
jgi:hypothetical protein